MISISLFTLLIVSLLFQTYTNLNIENRYNSNKFILNLFNDVITHINEDELNVIDHEGFLHWSMGKIGPLVLMLNTNNTNLTFLPLIKTPYYILKSGRVTQIRQKPTNDEDSSKIIYEDKNFTCEWKDENGASDTSCKHLQTAFKYKTFESFEMQDYEGVYDNYKKNGYKYTLDLKISNKSAETYGLVRKSNWIDDKTLVLIVELDFYNPNSNIWNIVQMSSESSKFGIVTTKVSTRNYIGHYVFQDDKHSKRYSSDTNPIARVFIYHFNSYFVLIAIYTTHEGFQLLSLVHNNGFFKGFKIYTSTFENFLDWLIIILSIVIESLQLYRNYYLTEQNTMFINQISHHEFMTFSNIAANEAWLIDLHVITIVIVFIKLLNLLKFNRKTYLITETLKKEFSGLLLLITLVCMNFCVLGVVGFVWFHGDTQFSSISNAIMTSLLSTVQHLNLNKIIDEIGPRKIMYWLSLAWYVGYKISIAFILSVIMSQLRIVREEQRKSQSEVLSRKIFLKLFDYFNLSKNFKNK